MSLIIKTRLTRRLLVLTVTFMSIVALPLIFVIVLLLLKIRTILKIYTKLFKPKIRHLLTGMTSVISSDCPYKNPLMNTVMYAILKGHMSLEKLQEEAGAAIEKFDEHKPSPIFYQLKCKLSSLMGFSVWEDELEFSVKDHVKLLEPRELNQRLLARTDGVERMLEIPRRVDTENISQLAYLLSMVPFEEGMSPWEMIIHENSNLPGDPNSNEPQTILFLRMHHVMGDVPSVFSFLSKLTGLEKFPEKMALAMSPKKRHVTVGNRKKCGYILHCLKMATFPFVAIHDVLDLFMEAWDNNVWHRGIPRPRTEFIFSSCALPLETIKRVRKGRGVGFFNVLLAAYSGALRKFMMKKGLKIPLNMHTLISIPRPRDLSKLANDVTGTILALPVGLTDRQGMIEGIQKEAGDLKSSLAPQGIWLWGLLVGLLPKVLSLHLNFWFVTTCFAVNAPGFEDQLSICGCPWLTMSGLASMPGAAGIYIYASSYMDKLTITLGCSKDLKGMGTLESVRECREFIEQELKALEDPLNNLILSHPPFCENKMTILSIESLDGTK